MLAGHLPDCQETPSAQNSRTEHTQNADRQTATAHLTIGSSNVEYIRLVSARSSFFRLIRSLRPSASRLAAVILVCICSELMSFDILKISPRGLERLLAHSRLLRRREVCCWANQGGWGRWTNGATAAALKAPIARAKRTSRGEFDRPRKSTKRAAQGMASR